MYLQVHVLHVLSFQDPYPCAVIANVTAMQNISPAKFFLSLQELHLKKAKIQIAFGFVES